jgi:hypothetical protein
LPVGNCGLDGVGNLVAGLVDVSQPVCFVNDNQIPRRLPNISLFGPGELVGAKNNLGLVEWIEVAAFDFLVEGLGFEDR